MVIFDKTTSVINDLISSELDGIRAMKHSALEIRCPISRVKLLVYLIETKSLKNSNFQRQINASLL